MPNREGLEPGNVEGFGLAFLEAAAVGMPAIGGDSGGVGDAIGDGQTGFLVPENDVESVTSHLERLINDPAERARMAALQVSECDQSLRGNTWRAITCAA